MSSKTLEHKLETSKNVIKMLVAKIHKLDAENASIQKAMLDQYNDLQQRIWNLKATGGKHEFLTEQEVRDICAAEAVEIKFEEPESFLNWLWSEGYDEAQLTPEQLYKLGREAWKLPENMKLWAVDLAGRALVGTPGGQVLWYNWDGSFQTAGVEDILKFAAKGRF